jgi:anti-sigma28 factor (negative regulator of flagellin synthesis)
MKVNDHGFTERLGTPATTAPPKTGQTGNSRSLAQKPETGSGDDLRLSGFAARLNSQAAVEASNRAQHVTQIATAVNTGSFRIDNAATSHSIVSEGLQGGDR